MYYCNYQFLVLFHRKVAAVFCETCMQFESCPFPLIDRTIEQIILRRPISEEVTILYYGLLVKMLQGISLFIFMFRHTFCIDCDIRLLVTLRMIWQDEIRTCDIRVWSCIFILHCSLPAVCILYTVWKISEDSQIERCQNLNSITGTNKQRKIQCMKYTHVL